MSYIDLSSCAYPKLPGENKGIFPADVQIEITRLETEDLNFNSREQIMEHIEQRLAQSGRCLNTNKDLIDDTRIHNFAINDLNLHNFLKTVNAVNSDLHANISCMIDGMIAPLKDTKAYVEKDFVLSSRQEFKSSIFNVKQIGKKSVFGYALKASMRDDADLFVIKTPKTLDVDDLAHEAVVGLYALNFLRRYLPNYMYIYSYTRCSPPLISDKNILTWCSSEKPGASYLITENVRDAVAFSDFILDPNVNKDDLLVVLLQVINALNLANNFYSFTHYDLHAENILVRTFDSPIAVPFYNNDCSKVIGYLASKYVPYIIDFGNSTVRIGNYSSGKLSLSDYIPDPLKPFPLHDVYKLICFLGQSFVLNGTYDMEKYKILQEAFSYFREGSLVDRVNRRLSDRNDYFELSTHRDKTIGDIIDWLVERNMVKLHTDMNYLLDQGVISAPIGDFMDTCHFYEIINSGKPPDDNVEYCKIVLSIDNDTMIDENEKIKARKWLDDNYDSEVQFLLNIKELENIIKSLETEFSNFNISMINSSFFVDRRFIDKYRTQLYSLARLKEYVSITTAVFKADVCALSIQGKTYKHKIYIDKIERFIKRYTKIFFNSRTIAKANLVFVNKNIAGGRIDNKNIPIAMNKQDIDYANKFWTREIYTIIDTL